jgi:acetyl esterase
MTMVKLDPQIQAVLDQMAAQPEPETPPTLEEIRAGARAGHVALSPPGVDMAEIRHETVPSANGDVSVIIDIPRATDEALPVLMYFHGGGLMLLDAEAFNPTCTELAQQADCIVVNVDYHRTPEHPFPGPFESALAAYAWVRENAASFGGDPSRVGVAGDSGGSSLAALICLDAKDSGGPQPSCQALVYPQVDYADLSEDMLTVDAFVNKGLIDQLNGAHAVPDILDPRASPLRAADHSGLAPALIVAASYDPLHAQGRAYAAILRNAGVEVDYSLYEGMCHAFFTWGAAVDKANDAVSEVAAWVKGKLAA